MDDGCSYSSIPVRSRQLIREGARLPLEVGCRRPATACDLPDPAADAAQDYFESIPVSRIMSRHGSRVSAAQIMSPPRSSIGEGASLLDAARRMAAYGLQRILVTGDDGKIVGIVSALDILRWISRALPTGEGVAGTEAV